MGYILVFIFALAIGVIFSKAIKESITNILKD